MSERHKTLRGMIARRFVNPSGDEAVLEIPAGWSNLKHYTLTTYRKDGSISKGPNQVQCESAAAARAAASECEKKALSQGWLPKTGVPMASLTQAPWTVSMYRQDGTPVRCRIKHAAIERHVDHRDGGSGFRIAVPRPGYDVTLLASMPQGEQLEPGTVLMVRWVEAYVTTDHWAVVQRLEYRDSPSRMHPDTFEDWHIELSPIEQPHDAPLPDVAISRAEFRARTIQRVSDRDWKPQDLWAELATDFPDASERQLVIGHIMAQRQRLQQQAAETERRRIEEIMQAERQRPAPAQRQLPVPAPQRPARSLTGGEDITKPKRRKMNL